MSEPYIPALSATLIVTRETSVESFDFESDEPDEAWIPGLRIGDITLHTGMDDAEALEVIDRLSEALRELRDDIDRRQTIAAHGPLPTADEVLGILS